MKKKLKRILIKEVISDLKNNLYDNHDYIFELVYEALAKRTKQDLKDILYGQ